MEMRRKDVVARLQDWFDVSSPAVTKALRRMARPPLGLVRLVEDAASGREKRVRLTPQGQRFVFGMITRGQDFLHRVVEQLPEQQVREGIAFLRAGVAAYESIHAESPGLDNKIVQARLRSQGELAAQIPDEPSAPDDAAATEAEKPEQTSRSPL
jgi:DNA-binding MarR family transcriptional regulator